MTDDAHGEDQTHDHHDDHDHGEDRPDYDPDNVDLPSGAPPLRSTAPQSDFTMRQVGIGIAVTVVGLALVFGLPLALA
jgi:hypothetical protein